MCFFRLLLSLSLQSINTDSVVTLPTEHHDEPILTGSGGKLSVASDSPGVSLFHHPGSPIAQNLRRQYPAHGSIDFGEYRGDRTRVDFVAISDNHQGKLQWNRAVRRVDDSRSRAIRIDGVGSAGATQSTFTDIPLMTVCSTHVRSPLPSKCATPTERNGASAGRPGVPMRSDRPDEIDSAGRLNNDRQELPLLKSPAHLGFSVHRGKGLNIYVKTVSADAANGPPDFPGKDFLRSFGRFVGKDRERTLRSRRPSEGRLQPVRKRQRSERQPPHRQDYLSSRQHRRLEELKHAD
jgi:hypothetical protein